MRHFRTKNSSSPQNFLHFVEFSNISWTNPYKKTQKFLIKCKIKKQKEKNKKNPEILDKKTSMYFFLIVPGPLKTLERA